MILETTDYKNFNVIINNNDDQDILNVLKNKNISIIFKNSDSNVQLNAEVVEEGGNVLIKTNYFNTAEPVQF